VQSERFVLNYEKLERTKNPRHNNIKIISENDVSAGYDIQSYKNDGCFFKFPSLAIFFPILIV
jgi:hypothetical protein